MNRKRDTSRLTLLFSAARDIIKVHDLCYCLLLIRRECSEGAVGLVEHGGNESQIQSLVRVSDRYSGGKLGTVQLLALRKDSSGTTLRITLSKRIQSTDTVGHLSQKILRQDMSEKDRPMLEEGESKTVRASESCKSFPKLLMRLLDAVFDSCQLTHRRSISSGESLSRAAASSLLLASNRHINSGRTRRFRDPKRPSYVEGEILKNRA